MRAKKIMAGVLLILLSGMATGCGKTEIDVMENVEVRFNGVDGYGTAWIANEYDWEDAAAVAIGGDDSEDISLLGDMMKIESAVSFELYPKEGLSNGDEVTVKATADNEKVKDYKIKFKAGEKKFTVEGLKEVEQTDLFDKVEVQFQGIAPYITASVKYDNPDSSIYVRYSIDINEGLSVGDTVTVTAEFDSDSLLQNGYAAGDDRKEYVVPESDRYVKQIAEIPEDTIEKMNKQFEDTMQAFVANNWDETATLESIDYIGGYLLTAKEGMNVSEKNIFYGVYKLRSAIPEDEFSYYMYCRYRNIIILKDGTCSVDLTDYKIPSCTTLFWGEISGEGFRKADKYTYSGYEEIDSLFNNCVTKNIEQYEYESSVTGE